MERIERTEMTEQTTSQVRDDVGQKAADPFATWRAAARENVERMEAFFAEADRMESESLERTKRAMDESARLAVESMTWAARTSAEWRKLVLGGMRRTAEG